MATLKALKETARQYGCASLLGQANAKTVKGEKRGYLTSVLYMMPDDNLCPMSRAAGCREACLVSAGRAAFTPGIGKARAGRTKFYHANKGAFLELLCKEIDAFIKKAKKQGLVPAIRLNGTSDINWAKVGLEDAFPYAMAPNIFYRYSDVQFYDYTKRPDIIRAAQTVPNWHVTASYSEADVRYSKAIVKAARAHRANLAVVFDSKRYPAEFMGMPVLNGDETDLRFLDAPGHIVALYAKGKAKQDNTGFVINANIIAKA